MAKKILIDPVTRLEGHLALKVEVENGQVSKAFSKGEMFRGFEQILLNRDPMDAQQITQRICGVCPIAHGTASILAQDDAYGIKPPENGRLLRNLILGANYIQSHIVHFYQLSALDFVDIAAILHYKGQNAGMNELKSWAKTQLESKLLYPVAPFLPRFAGDYIKDININLGAIEHYLEALDMRRLAHQMAAVFSGKIPHAASLIAGGVTERIDPRKILYYQSRLDKLHDFIKNRYLPDVIAVAKAYPQYFSIGRGNGNFLAYGAFPQSDQTDDLLFPGGVILQGKYHALDISKITEQVRHSWFKDQDSNLHPSEGKTDPTPEKSQAYSWLKAPRYDNHVMEVGPLARMLVAYQSGRRPEINQRIDHLLKTTGLTADALNSMLGRHAARALETLFVAEQCDQWLQKLDLKKPVFTPFTIPKESRGVGLTEAPRGALGHWLEIKDHRISNYQCVVPTTWNCSPRDDYDNPGVVEQALVGTPIADPDNPLEATRVVRSFDPCLACAVH
ncbi:nickel-dependent hydrogenase large subunit [Magnetococcales bacterium HHB-1]